MILNTIVSVLWWVYLYRNILTAIVYFRYYDLDNKILKLFLLVLYSFSDEITSFLFLVEYARIFLSMKMIKCINLYRYVRWMEYNLLTGIIYPYYGTFMLNTTSRVVEMMMIIFLLDLYGRLNNIVYVRFYSKYKKNRCSCNNIMYKKRLYLRQDDISEYYRIKSKLDKYCVYILIMYNISIISYNMWIYTFYLYYMSLIVENYYMLDKILLNNTRIKENENLCNTCEDKVINGS